MDRSQFVHPDTRTFERQLLQLASARKNSDLSVNELIEILEKVNIDQTLSARERWRRTQLIIESWRPDTRELDALARRAATWSPEVRNGLLNCLPPDLQHLAYGTEIPTSGAVARKSEAGVRDIGVTQPIPAAPITTITDGTENERRERELPEEGREQKIVLLLGAADKHAANISLLKQHGFEPVRASTVSERDKLLSNPICGIIVDGTWWSILPPENHEDELSRFLRYSTFAFVRIDETGLKPGTNLQSLFRGIRCREPLATEFAWAADSRLTGNDITVLSQAASDLVAGRVCRFHPAEINDREGTILLAAIRKKVRARHPLNGFTIERVDTSLIIGGRTGGKVFVLRPDDGGAPFVAKVDSIPRLTDEMIRFSTFIKPRENRLQPELHVHDDVGVILFGLIEDAERGDGPAPTLADRMELLGAIERGGKPTNPPNPTHLRTAVKRTVEKLFELNSEKCPDTKIPDLCWLGIEPLHEMRRQGITYSLKNAKGSIDLINSCTKASARISLLKGKAVVHGDTHGRNVLVRDDVEPFLIDYAYSGPGHPCFDLARLAASLLFSNVRMTIGEEELEECFRELFLCGKSFEELKKAFPDCCASAGTAISIEGAVLATTAAVNLAKKYGGDTRDYLAVSFVIACQSVTMYDFQTGVVRAVIRALAPSIEAL